MTIQNTVRINAEERLKVGTGSAKAARRANKVPAVIYGKGREPISLLLPYGDFIKHYQSKSLNARIVELDIAGKVESVLMKSVQKHIVTGMIQHVDFQFADKNQEIRIEIPLLFTNESKCIGIKRGGVLNILHRTVSIRCLPHNIPKHIEVDLANVSGGHALHVNDLVLPDGIKVDMKEDNPAILMISATSSQKDAEDDQADKESEKTS